MHVFLHLLAQTTSPTTKPGSSKGSSSIVPLLVIVGLFAVVYIFFLRPRQQRMRQQQTASRTLAVGDEVMSAGGIYGRVVALDSDQVEVEVSPGVVMTFTRRAINPRPQTAAKPAPEPQDEPWTREAGGGAIGTEAGGSPSGGDAGPGGVGGAGEADGYPPAAPEGD